MNRLEGKTAIVTGAASGMGEGIAEMFAEEGANVVATDIQGDILKNKVEEIKDNGGQIMAAVHDVTSEQSWEDVVHQTLDAFGQIDILVNNAGITSPNRDIHHVTMEEWDKVMNVNSTGVYLGMRFVIEEMVKKENRGSVINISSIAGIVGSSSPTAYTAAKGAVRSLTKNAAVSYAKHSIRVNSIHPGFIETPMIEGLLENKERHSMIYDNTPLPYLGEPKDIAYGAVYLASDEAKFITGSELVIDGGYIAG
ncbi:SDR family NAD(P)-dependent oxidoreductase [Salibacterium aidingense]|uniref:SDR family NAD(P)-dependent oxidoreductase n=1 Tax=Salibacterium aidingense TaxID=384933 RepID=UPI003BCF20B8